jgi:ABC-type oligopeptide transport system substrate-binding subunit
VDGNPRRVSRAHDGSELGRRGEPALARDRQAQQRLTRPAQFEADAGARRARYIQMEDILEREVRLIPRFHENQWRLARPEVEGLATTFFFPIVNFEELRIRR